jgi:hypothetical protein
LRVSSTEPLASRRKMSSKRKMPPLMIIWIHWFQRHPSRGLATTNPAYKGEATVPKTAVKVKSAFGKPRSCLAQILVREAGMTVTPIAPAIPESVRPASTVPMFFASAMGRKKRTKQP